MDSEWLRGATKKRGFVLILKETGNCFKSLFKLGSDTVTAARPRCKVDTGMDAEPKGRGRPLKIRNPTEGGWHCLMYMGREPVNGSGGMATPQELPSGA